MRFSKRDAAGCLLQLDLTEEEEAAEPAVSRGTLLALNFCSHAWLLGRAAAPTEGYGPAELAAGVDQMALGAAGDEGGSDGEVEEEEGDEEVEAEGGGSDGEDEHGAEAGR